MNTAWTAILYQEFDNEDLPPLDELFATMIPQELKEPKELKEHQGLRERGQVLQRTLVINYQRVQAGHGVLLPYPEQSEEFSRVVAEGNLATLIKKFNNPVSY